MQLLRTLGVLLLAAFIGLVLGATKEYLKLWPESGYEYVWPFAMSAAAFAGALLMAVLGPVRQSGLPQRSAGSTPLRGKQAASPKAASTTQEMPTGMQTSAEVPGMPTFDFDKAQATAQAMDNAQQNSSKQTNKPREQA